MKEIVFGNIAKAGKMSIRKYENGIYGILFIFDTNLDKDFIGKKIEEKDFNEELYSIWFKSVDEIIKFKEYVFVGSSIKLSDGKDICFLNFMKQESADVFNSWLDDLIENYNKFLIKEAQ